MKRTAEYRRGVAVLTVALAALGPARPGLAQVTSSTSSPAATTSTTARVTTTSTMVQLTTTAPPLVVLPNDPLFPTSPDTSSVGPTVTASIPMTITTVVELPFSTPFSQATTTSVGVETIASGSTTTEPATTTTTTTPTTTTAAPPPRLQVATVPAPAPASSEAGSGPGAWTVLASGVVLGAALVAWRRLRGMERG